MEPYMAIHPKDRKANNPRLQCSCCGKWKRLVKEDGTHTFFGGCGYTNGDHLAGKVGSDNCNDICDACCQIECKRLSDLAMIEEQTNPCIAPIIEIGAP